MVYIEIVNSNVPRFDHDPDTRETVWGLLVEPSRTIDSLLLTVIQLDFYRKLDLIH